MQNRSFVYNLKKGIGKRINKLFSNPYRETGLNWFDIKKLKHLPSGKLRSHSFLGKQISFIDPAEFLHGVKEIFIEELYKQDLPPRPYILDCGANIGLSVIYLKKRFPEARIVAFEPDDTNFDLLEKNVEAYNFKDITLRKEAVWTQQTTLNFAGSGSMSSRIDESGNSDTKLVKAIRLKDLLTERVDFLKIDIEGAEYAVLNDIKDDLHRILHLFIEYHGSFAQASHLNGILDWVTKAGFSYYIKEAASVFNTPFSRGQREGFDYDVQLNLFCFRDGNTK